MYFDCGEAWASVHVSLVENAAPRGQQLRDPASSPIRRATKIGRDEKSGMMGGGDGVAEGRARDGDEVLRDRCSGCRGAELPSSYRNSSRMPVRGRRHITRNVIDP